MIILELVLLPGFWSLRARVVYSLAPLCEMKLWDVSLADWPWCLRLDTFLFSVGQLCFLIRQRVSLRPEEALFFFVNNSLPPSSSPLSAVYEVTGPCNKNMYKRNRRQQPRKHVYLTADSGVGSCLTLSDSRRNSPSCAACSVSHLPLTLTQHARIGLFTWRGCA